MNPKHNNPTRPDRIAHAPYNFVPLPDQIVQVDYDIPSQDIYTGYTGYLDCTLTTLSPTYTRAALNPEFFAEFADSIQRMMRNEQARETYAQFFCLDDAHRPIIPGSSLHGMVRTLVEIAGYAKIQWVTHRRLFFRTVDATAVGQYYRDRMTNNVEGGFLRKHGEQYYIKKCHVARLHRKKLGGKHNLYEGSSPNLTPRWTGKPGQYIPVWVRLTNNGRFVEQIEFKEEEGLREGRLVITGDVPKKKKEFVFLLPDEDAEEIPVDEGMIERFHDEDQITQWQEKAFPKNKPQSDCRQRDGMLRKDSFLREEGDPVFFLRENDQVTFFGRAQMFRLPYTYSPLELVPLDLRRQNDHTIDLAEAIFGYVPEGDRTTSRAGRVFFTDAVCEPEQENIWLTEKPITPQILASPKPTTFQHYLVQDREKGHDPDDKRELAHYGTPTPDETVIRGHKLYWHKQGGLEIEDFREAEDVHWDTDSQHTQIKPVRAGVKFRFRVYFENLTEVELGALLWVLDLPEGHHHKVGMGKPLGLGSVSIEPCLILTIRPDRYRRLFEGERWYTGETKESDKAKFKQEFEQYVLDHMDQDERQGVQSLAEVKRIQMLLKMLEWPGPSFDTGYMELKKFKNRPVLPTPLPKQGEMTKRHSDEPRLEVQSPMHLLRKGQHFKATIFEVGREILLEIHGIDADDLAYAVILPQDRAGNRQYREGDDVLCQVISVEEETEGYYRVRCRDVG